VANCTEVEVRMEPNEQEGVTSTHRGRLKVVGVVGTAALVGLLVVSQVTSSHSSARAAAAATACASYVTGNKPSTSGSSSSLDATVVDAYPTTASKLGKWLLNFDPMGLGSAYRSIPRNESVSACVIRGKWDLPNQSTLSGNVVNYAIVMITHNGTATPLMFGPSKFASEAPPAV
jgi:hypothetical protein